MIWLTWRQQRLEMLIGGALTLLVAVLVIRTRLDLRSTYRILVIAAAVLFGLAMNALLAWWSWPADQIQDGIAGLQRGRF
jgi:hypothetical protein